jgi:hypothetical protein
MNSPGHRAIIPMPAVERLGIGIIDRGMYGLSFPRNLGINKKATNCVVAWRFRHQIF